MIAGGVAATVAIGVARAEDGRLLDRVVELSVESVDQFSGERAGRGILLAEPDPQVEVQPGEPRFDQVAPGLAGQQLAGDGPQGLAGPSSQSIDRIAHGFIMNLEPPARTGGKVPGANGVIPPGEPHRVPKKLSDDEVECECRRLETVLAQLEALASGEDQARE